MSEKLKEIYPVLDEPTHMIFSQSVDPEWALNEARWIVDNLPPSDYANASGKFFKNYIQWSFHKTSSQPLIKKFAEILEASKEEFRKIYNRNLDFEFIYLAYVKDIAQECSIWHRDYFLINGQAHLSILGNGDLLCYDYNDQLHNIKVPNGTCWFVNGSNFTHKINTGVGERFEICSPISPRKEIVEPRMLGIKPDDPLKLVDGTLPAYIEGQRKLKEQTIGNIKKGKDTHGGNVADFST